MRKPRTYISFDPTQIPKMDHISKSMGGLDRSDLVRIAISELIQKFEKQHGEIQAK